jgi:hypothetical protein
MVSRKYTEPFQGYNWLFFLTTIFTQLQERKKSMNKNDIPTYWMNDSMSEWMSVVWIRKICYAGITDLTRHIVL